MNTGERAHAILSEFAEDYVFVVKEDTGYRIGISSSAFGRACLEDLEAAINRAEHHEKQQEIREARKEAAKDNTPPPQDKDD